MNSFRLLNDNEMKAISAVFRKGKLSDLRLLGEISTLEVSYEKFPGGFTVCLVKLAERKPRSLSDSEIASLQIEGIDGSDWQCIDVYLWRGVSRRSNKDKHNTTRGDMLAFVRAITQSESVKIGV